MARVDLPQSRLRARKRRQRLLATIKITALLVFVIGLVLGVLWLPHLRVVKISVTGLEGSAAKAIETAALNYITGRYAFVIPKNNILLYPKRSLTEYVRSEYPRFSEVQVYAEDLRTVGIQVRERMPESLWCGPAPTERTQCLFMDDTGAAYETAVQFSGTVYTEYFGTVSGDTLPKQYLTPEKYRVITALVQAFKEKEGESIARVAVDEHEDVRATFTNGFTLMFTATENTGEVYERFLLAKTAEPFASRQLGDFDYLDLRFGDRLYYKLKTE